MSELKIEYLSVKDIKPYDKNAKKHPKNQIEHIANSIREFGFQQPLVIDKDNILVIGHGRLLAAKKLKIDSVPCVRADELTEDQIKALRLADNKTNESPWDSDLLELELDGIEMDMKQFGFSFTEEEQKYTLKEKIPQYQITGECPLIVELYDRDKTNNLIEEIKNSNVSEEDKQFLMFAAERHCVFNYAKIAEYYAHADAEMQSLMEKSALVIIDVNDAIANGFVKLTKTLEKMRGTT